MNGSSTSVQSPRARALFGDIAKIVFKEKGRLGSIPTIRKELREFQGDWIYCIDMGIPGAVLAALRKKRGRPVRLTYELGDPARPLLEAQGVSASKVALADWLDRHLPLRADRLVFRGTYLVDYFKKLVEPRSLPPWIWLPDGVDINLFRPNRDDPEVAALRKAHNLEGRFVVGLVGSIHHIQKLKLFYGWDLAEALSRIPADVPMTGIVVGDGPGMSVLEAERDRLGLGDRLKLVGRVPHAEVPLWMNLFDVALSTQTDDPVGWGRTTAKLPEYLASGTAVVCTDVGEAHRLLKDTGQTLPYQGMRDDSYPERLANRLCELKDQDLQGVRAQTANLR